MRARLGWAALGLVVGAVLCIAFRHQERAVWRASLQSLADSTRDLEARTAAHDSADAVAADTIAALGEALALARTDDSVATAQLVPVRGLKARRDSVMESDTACAPAIKAATDPLLAQLERRDTSIAVKQRAIQSYDRMNAILTGQLVTERLIRDDWQASSKKWQKKAEEAPVRGQRGIYAYARGFVALGDSLDVGAAGGVTWRTGGGVNPYTEVEWRRNTGREVRVGGQVEVRLF